MIDHTANQLALRAHAAALVVCTTGVTDLAASAAGYTRPAGSFVADGFRAGMEVTPAGFPQTEPGVVTRVEAAVLTILGGRTVAAQLGGRSLTVGLPVRRALDNEAAPSPTGRPWVEEDYVPGTGRLIGMTPQGTKEDTGLYVLRWYGLKDLGIAGLTRCVDQLLEHFKPGTTFALPGNASLRVRGDIAPTRGQLLADRDGWSVIAATIPWRHYALN